MKKEDFSSFIVYLLMIALALILGFTLIRSTFMSIYDAEMNSYVFALLTILGGLLVNAIGLEIGHVLGGLVGGYSIVCFNVLGLCFYKKEGKTKFGFKSYDGLTGETRLAPKKEKANPKAYVWFPLIMYLIELIVCIILYSVGAEQKNVPHSPLKVLATISVILIAISSMIALYNFIPLKLDSMTDGYRLTLISKPINIEAYNELMRVENLQRDGKEVGKIKVFTEVTDFTSTINLMTVYEYLANKNFEAAEKLIDMMIVEPDKISKTTYNRLIAQKLYISILTKPIEEVRKYYDEQINDNLRRFISNDMSMESLRAYVLIAGILDESQGEVEFANSKKARALKRALPSRAKIEKGLYEDALNKIYSIHPEWKASEEIKK